MRKKAKFLIACYFAIIGLQIGRWAMSRVFTLEPASMIGLAFTCILLMWEKEKRVALSQEPER